MMTTQDGASSDQTSTEEIAEAQRVRRTHEIEEHLQAGCVSEAIKMGWCGSLASYELVKTGEGTTAVKVRLSGSTLGFGLSNDRGIAVVIDADNSSTLRSGDVVRSVNSVRLFTCEAVVGAIRNATTTYGVVSLRLGRPNPLQSSPVKAGPPAPAVTLEDLRRQEQLEAQLEAHREAQKEAHLGTLMLHVPNAATQRASSSARSARLHLDDLVGLSLSEPPTPSPPTPPSPRGSLAAAARDMPSVLGRSPSPVYEAKLGAAVAQAPARATRMARRSIAARDEEGGGKVVDGKVVVDGASRDGASFSGTRGDSASLGHSASFAAVSDIPESVALATAALDEAVEATLEGDGDLVDLICAIATHAEAAAGSEPLRRALRRRDELVAGPSAQETPAKAPAPPTQTVRSPPHTQLTPSPSRLSQPPRQLTTGLTQPCAGPLATADAVHIPLGRCSRSPSTTLRCSTVPLRATWTQRPS
eukprot:scaffold24082_cov74-Phaeocystis_antarctica.AAC.1